MLRRAETPSKLLQRVAAICGVVLAGVALSTAWLDARWFVATWFSLTAFFFLCANRPRWMGFVFGFVYGALGLGLAFGWSVDMLSQSIGLEIWQASIVFAGLVAWESVPFGALGACATRLSHERPWQLLWLPSVWIPLEAFWPRVFRWQLAHSQTDVLPLLQIADLGGAASIGLIMLLVTAIAAIWLLWLRDTKPAGLPVRSQRLLGPTCVVSAIAVAALAYGLVQLSLQPRLAQDRPVLSVGLLQADTSYLATHPDLSKRSYELAGQVDLVCWPESSIGCYQSSLASFQDQETIKQFSRGPERGLRPLPNPPCMVLAGGKDFDSRTTPEDGPYFQTAYLIDRDETILGRYYKRRLMPIGEYCPGQYYFPELRQVVNVDDLFVPGNDPKPLVTREGAKLGVLICYEDIVASVARDSVRHGAELLITIINASRFESPIALEQHMRLALLRAVENRRYFLRTAGTGVTCVIDPCGRIIDRAPIGEKATLLADVPLLTTRTLNSYLGDFLPWLCVVGLTLYTARARFSPHWQGVGPSA